MRRRAKKTASTCIFSQKSVISPLSVNTQLCIRVTDVGIDLFWCRGAARDLPQNLALKDLKADAFRWHHFSESSSFVKKIEAHDASQLSRPKLTWITPQEHGQPGSGGGFYIDCQAGIEDAFFYPVQNDMLQWNDAFVPRGTWQYRGLDWDLN